SATRYFPTRRSSDLLQQEAIRNPVEVTADPATGRIRRLRRDPCRRKRCGVGDARVAAAFVDEGGPLPGDAVELGAVRLPPLSQRSEEHTSELQSRSD